MCIAEASTLATASCSWEICTSILEPRAAAKVQVRRQTTFSKVLA
jgi:hypothetical protein